MFNAQDLVNLDLYKSHKEVLASKIYEIALYKDIKARLERVNERLEEDTQLKEAFEGLEEGGAYIVCNNDNGTVLTVSKEYMEKHNPQVGGYFVQYKDGYQSWSPAEAFESGYTLVVEKKEIKSDI